MASSISEPQRVCASGAEEEMEKEGARSEVETKVDEQAGSTASAAAAAAEEEKEKKKKMHKVLVAIDESEGSLNALSWALTNLFAGAAHETTVVLLHVQQPFQQYIFPAGPGIYATSGVIESVRKAQQHSSAALLARALALCKGKPLIKVESIVLDGEPKETICEVAEKIPVDLVVVGSRGLSAIKRAFLGSVSDYCAHHAKCPVLIVRPSPQPDSDRKE